MAKATHNIKSSNPRNGMVVWDCCGCMLNVLSLFLLKTFCGISMLTFTELRNVWTRHEKNRLFIRIAKTKTERKKKQNRRKKLQKALIVSVLGAWCLIIFILCFLHICFLFLTCISVFVHFCHSFCLYFDRVTNAIIPTLLLPRLFECFGERHFVVAYYFRFCSSFLKIVMFFFVFFVVRNSFSFVWFRFISFCLLFLFVRIILAVSYCRCQTIEIS